MAPVDIPYSYPGSVGLDWPSLEDDESKWACTDYKKRSSVGRTFGETMFFPAAGYLRNTCCLAAVGEREGDEKIGKTEHAGLVSLCL